MCATNGPSPARPDRGTGVPPAADAFFRRLVESSPDWTIEVATDGRVAYSSPACRPLLGVAPEAFQNDPGILRQLLHPDSRPPFAALAEAFRLQGKYPEG